MSEPAILDSITFTLQGYEFQLPVRYKPGHVCSAIEAGVLNKALTDRIYVNFSLRMRDRFPAGAVLSSKEIHDLQQDILDYAEGYSFRALTQRQNADPITREAHRIASLRIREALNARSQTKEEFGLAKYERAVAKLMASPSVMEEAQRRVQEHQAIAEELLELDV